ncbi:hypothetical protein C8J56DRAFT_890467 [Mycena floridula]|nr:hypothetical protein C8J56DRAFT_890467 [Mycena floridula]
MFSFPTEDSSTGIDVGAHWIEEAFGFSEDSLGHTDDPPIIICKSTDMLISGSIHCLEGSQTLMTTSLLDLVRVGRATLIHVNPNHMIDRVLDGKQRKSLLIKYTTSQLDLSKNNRVDGISRDSPWFGSGRSLCVGDDLDILYTDSFEGIVKQARRNRRTLAAPLGQSTPRVDRPPNFPPPMGSKCIYLPRSVGSRRTALDRPEEFAKGALVPTMNWELRRREHCSEDHFEFGHWEKRSASSGDSAGRRFGAYRLGSVYRVSGRRTRTFYAAVSALAQEGLCPVNGRRETKTKSRGNTRANDKAQEELGVRVRRWRVYRQ